MPTIRKPRSGKGFAVFCARIAQSKQAENIVVMNLSKIDGAPSDYFIVCTCNSEAQVRAVADAIELACDQLNMGNPRTEGRETYQWVILDYFDVVVHVFHKEARDFYKLEKRWADASFATLEEDGSVKAVKVKKEKTTTLGQKDNRDTDTDPDENGGFSIN